MNGFAIFVRWMLLVLVSVNCRAQIIGCGLPPGAVDTSCVEISKTFGDSYNDAGYTREIGLLTSAFRVHPGFFLCRESNGPNAFATEATIDPGTTGSVFLGVALAKSEVRRTGQYNNFTLPAILAHETAHILQFRHGSDLPTKAKELQADYLAGWYMANRDPGGTPWSATSARQAMIEFYLIGDYDFNDSGHHGTSEERLTALMSGTRNAGEPLSVVYNKSREFALSISVNLPKESIDLRSTLGKLASLAKSGFRSIRGPLNPFSAGGASVALLLVPDSIGCDVWKGDASLEIKPY